ncbi:DUF433 domain-containing protein [Rhodoflexus caldus]|uniref:DUF433 domain-containing protein n=1 Tax=Rhodoflexus caldus TaxID=2891236 RepID=UPI00293F54D6|nr:DUF433 domain-containing protein [Rhodoflexus caldus]
MEDIQTYISIDPQVRFGKPCTCGTRIAVQDILAWPASGMTFQDITEDFPEINEPMIRQRWHLPHKESVTSNHWRHEVVIGC